MTIIELINRLSEMGLSDKQINKLDLTTIIIEIDKKLNPIITKIIKEMI